MALLRIYVRSSCRYACTISALSRGCILILMAHQCAVDAQTLSFGERQVSQVVGDRPELAELIEWNPAVQRELVVLFDGSLKRDHFALTMTRLEFDSICALKQFIQQHPIEKGSADARNNPYYFAVANGSTDFDDYIAMLDREASEGRFDLRNYYAEYYDHMIEVPTSSSLRKTKIISLDSPGDEMLFGPIGLAEPNYDEQP